MDKSKLKQTTKDIGNLVRACVGIPFALTVIPVGLYCTVADVTDRVKYHNDRQQIDPNKPSPNTIDFPNGPKNRLRKMEQFYEKYVINVFYR